MQLHQLKRENKQKKSKRVGRGGKRGKTSGRGHKGQKAHGGTPRPQSRDIIKRIPKLRGHGKNRSKTVHSARKTPVVINLGTIEKYFSGGEVVKPETLAEKDLIKKRGKNLPYVKILSQGALTKKLTFSDVLFSEAAQEKIKESGSIVK